MRRLTRVVALLSIVGYAAAVALAPSATAAQESPLSDVPNVSVTTSVINKI